MSGASSNAAGWFTQLEPASRLSSLPRPDEVRLNEIVEPWQGDIAAVTRGRPVLIGYPHDEGVRRNGGRGGAALAPREIRRWLYRLTAWDPQGAIDLALRAPLDAGDIRQADSMEQMQNSLGEVVAEVLQRNAVPVILGGGHETAYGHYLGYVAAHQPVTIINLDAHLDVRPLHDGKGHSGSPFRQALEHPGQPLPGNRYICLGAQPQASPQKHVEYARLRGCIVRWRNEVAPALSEHFAGELDRITTEPGQIYVSIDADVASAADVPGVSAPNPSGISGQEVARCARLAGQCPAVSSIDLVEVNPLFDRDDQSAAGPLWLSGISSSAWHPASEAFQTRVSTWCPCRAKRDTLRLLFDSVCSGRVQSANTGRAGKALSRESCTSLRFAQPPSRERALLVSKVQPLRGISGRDEASGLLVYNATVDRSVASLRRAEAMLVLSRKLGEKIQISENITITVLEIDRGKIRLGIDAPRSVTVLREELANQSLARQSPQDPMLVGK